MSCDTLPMTTTPTVAHGALVKILRELRESGRYDYADAAAEVGVSERTIQRWENGDNLPNRGSLKLLGEFYGASPAQIQNMCDLARDAKQPGLMEKFKGGAPPEFRPFAEHEASAVQIDTFESDYIPGLAQTMEYLRAAHEAQLAMLTPKPKVVQALRQTRQERALTGRRHPPQIRMVIGVAAMIYLDALPEQVKRGQIDRLLEMNAMPTVDIRVVTTLHSAMSGSFTIMTPAPGAHGASRFAYMEAQDLGRYVEAPDTLSVYDQIFASVFDQAIPIEEYLHAKSMA